MGRRLGLTLLVLGASVAVLVSGAFAGPHGESARGGTLRLIWGAEPDSVDPALASGLIGSWALLNLTCAKLFGTSIRDAVLICACADQPRDVQYAVSTAKVLTYRSTTHLVAETYP